MAVWQKIIGGAGLLVLSALACVKPIFAADLLGVNEEKPLVTKGRVVDVACDLTNNCPTNCGNGKRQLGILTESGTLYLAAKSAAIFAGAVKDLLPYCGKMVEIDGSTTAQFGGTLLYIARMRLAEGTETVDPWQSTEEFTRDFAKRNNLAPDDMKVDEWYRFDKTATEAVQKHGKLGVAE